jgi:hypothetical protein
MDPRGRRARGEASKVERDSRAQRNLRRGLLLAPTMATDELVAAVDRAADPGLDAAPAVAYTGAA